MSLELILVIIVVVVIVSGGVKISVGDISIGNKHDHKNNKEN